MTGAAAPFCRLTSPWNEHTNQCRGPTDAALTMVQRYHASVAQCSRERSKVQRAKLLLKHAQRRAGRNGSSGSTTTTTSSVALASPAVVNSALPAFNDLDSSATALALGADDGSLGLSAAIVSDGAVVTLGPKGAVVDAEAAAQDLMRSLDEEEKNKTVKSSKNKKKKEKQKRKKQQLNEEAEKQRLKEEAEKKEKQQKASEAEAEKRERERRGAEERERERREEARREWLRLKELKDEELRTQIMSSSSKGVDLSSTLIPAERATETIDGFETTQRHQRQRRGAPVPLTQEGPEGPASAARGEARRRRNPAQEQESILLAPAPQGAPQPLFGGPSPGPDGGSSDAPVSAAIGTKRASSTDQSRMSAPQPAASPSWPTSVSTAAFPASMNVSSSLPTSSTSSASSAASAPSSSSSTATSAPSTALSAPSHSPASMASSSSEPSSLPSSSATAPVFAPGKRSAIGAGRSRSDFGSDFSDSFSDGFSDAGQFGTDFSDGGQFGGLSNGWGLGSSLTVAPVVPQSDETPSNAFDLAGHKRRGAGEVIGHRQSPRQRAVSQSNTSHLLGTGGLPNAFTSSSSGSSVGSAPSPPGPPSGSSGAPAGHQGAAGVSSLTASPPEPASPPTAMPMSSGQGDDSVSIEAARGLLRQIGAYCLSSAMPTTCLGVVSGNSWPHDAHRCAIFRLIFVTAQNRATAPVRSPHRKIQARLCVILDDVRSGSAQSGEYSTPPPSPRLLSRE